MRKVASVFVSALLLFGSLGVAQAHSAAVSDGSLVFENGKMYYAPSQREHGSPVEDKSQWREADSSDFDGSYSYANGKLTLTDFRFETSAWLGLGITWRAYDHPEQPSLEIELIGDSKVSAWQRGIGTRVHDLSLTGSGSLTGATLSQGNGQQLVGFLFEQWPGTILIDGPTIVGQVSMGGPSRAMGVEAIADVEVRRGRLEGTVSSMARPNENVMGRSWGIYSVCGIDVKPGTTVIGEAGDTTDWAIGIFMQRDKRYMQTNPSGCTTQSLRVGGTVVGKSGKVTGYNGQTGYSFGIDADDHQDVIVDGGTLQAHAGDAYGYSAGLYSEHDSDNLSADERASLEISGGKVNVSAGTGKYSYGTFGFKSIDMRDSDVYAESGETIEIDGKRGFSVGVHTKGHLTMESGKLRAFSTGGDSSYGIYPIGGMTFSDKVEYLEAGTNPNATQGLAIALTATGTFEMVPSDPPVPYAWGANATGTVDWMFQDFPLSSRMAKSNRHLVFTHDFAQVPTDAPSLDKDDYNKIPEPTPSADSSQDGKTPEPASPTPSQDITASAEPSTPGTEPAVSPTSTDTDPAASSEQTADTGDVPTSSNPTLPITGSSTLPLAAVAIVLIGTGLALRLRR
ncbi:MAG: hypothetical protein LBR21_03280 [Propionibacteriaceae bacterium]|jgi:hypothetical protein|nr:hypothetical protein [Propionibacteriaceae bacterium]